MKEEAFVEVKQELVEVKAEAFEPTGVSQGQAVGDGFTKCSQCNYATSNVETLGRHVTSLHGREVEAMGTTKESSSDQSKEQPVLSDFDLGKRKRKVPARFLSPSSSPRSAPPAKFKTPPSSSAFTSLKSSIDASIAPGKSPNSKRKSPGSSKPSPPHSSTKAKQVRSTSPKPA